MRILVVDDDAPFRDGLKDALIGYGYEVVEAYSEQDAKTVLADHAKQVPVALVDLQMERKDAGVDLIRYMKKEYPWIVAVVITGHGHDDTAARSWEAGAFAFVEKREITGAVVLDKVEKALERHAVEFAIIRIREQFSSLANILELAGRLDDEMSPGGRAKRRR